MNNLGRVMESYRVQRRLTQRELATEMGIAPGTLSRIEQGQMFDVSTLMTLTSWLLREGVAVEAPALPLDANRAAAR